MSNRKRQAKKGKIYMKKEIKRINMTITPQLHRDAKIQCAKNETTLSKVVCQLLTEWLESQKQE